MKVFKQIVGVVGLIAFIGYMGYKFNDNISIVEDNWLISSILFVAVVLILLGIDRILRY